MMRATPFVIILLVTLSTVKSEQHESHSDHHKRQQLGFFGSRGRRSIADPPMTSTESELETVADPVKQISNLRQAFMGLQRNIRAPKGFFGMRGKKSYDDLDMDKRALIQQNMNALRERSRFVEPTMEDLNGDYQSYLPKRAPAQGFFGVRGKKFGDYDMGYNFSPLLSEKRAPSGFVGMRGKKSSIDMFDDSEIDDPQVFDYNYLEKRAPSGFFGVRGKKMNNYPQQHPNNFMYR